MTTKIRPEINGEYAIGKHRYYELKHFSLQYMDWKRELLCLDGYRSNTVVDTTKSSFIFDLEEIVSRRMALQDRISLIERCSYEAEPSLASYILKAVTEELSYVNLRTIHNIPCGKDVYYRAYRRYFWLLDKLR